MAKKDLYTKLVYARQRPFIGKFAYYFLKFLGVEIPLSVKIGEDFYLVHGAVGTVIHPNTTIGNRVKIYPGVVLGRADIQNPIEDSAFEGFVIEDDVILGAGAKVLCKAGVLRIAKGTILGANAVLFTNTQKNEKWVGIPAKKIE